MRYQCDQCKRKVEVVTSQDRRWLCNECLWFPKNEKRCNTFMEEVNKNKEIIKDKRLENLEKGKWKKGQSGNPKGHPKGKRNFDTIYEAALRKLAQLNDTTPESLEDEMASKAIIESRKGQFNFYKDTMDRRHGQATQKSETDINLKVSGVNIHVRK